MKLTFLLEPAKDNFEETLKIAHQILSYFDSTDPSLQYSWQIAQPECSKTEHGWTKHTPKVFEELAETLGRACASQKESINSTFVKRQVSSCRTRMENEEISTIFSPVQPNQKTTIPSQSGLLFVFISHALFETSELKNIKSTSKTKIVWIVLGAPQNTPPITDKVFTAQAFKLLPCSVLSLFMTSNSLNMRKIQVSKPGTAEKSNYNLVYQKGYSIT